MGQCFSSTVHIPSVESEDFGEIPDIVNQAVITVNGVQKKVPFVFSDGVGRVIHFLRCPV
jgi:hypothetical protein